MERLQKIIANSGHCSRREAERLIAAGRVTVDGVVATLGQSADVSRSVLMIDGHVLKGREKCVYIMLNKPRGYLSSVKDDRGRKTVADLLTQPSIDGETCNERVYPVGRLDLLSDGLLLLSNDGEFTRRMTHPSFEVPKYYHVRVRGNLSAIDELSRPQTIDGVTYQGAEVREVERDDIQRTALLSVTLREGKNREIRKLCETHKLDVLRLTRVGEGDLRLGGLRPGQWRYIRKPALPSAIR